MTHQTWSASFHVSRLSSPLHALNVWRVESKTCEASVVCSSSRPSLLGNFSRDLGNLGIDLGFGEFAEQEILKILINPNHKTTTVGYVLLLSHYLSCFCNLWRLVLLTYSVLVYDVSDVTHCAASCVSFSALMASIG